MLFSAKKILPIGSLAILIAVGTLSMGPSALAQDKCSGVFSGLFKTQVYKNHTLTSADFKRHRAVARSIRTQLNSQVPLETISINTKLMTPEVDYAIEGLRENLHLAPERPLALWRGRNFHAIERDTSQSKSEVIPVEPDIQLMKLLISELENWKSQPEGNYLKLLNLVAATTWAYARLPDSSDMQYASDFGGLPASLSDMTVGGSIGKIQTPANLDIETHFQSETRLESGQSVTWNIQNILIPDVIPSQTVLSLWQKNSALVPIPMNSELSAPAFQTYWERGIAPLGFILNRELDYDGDIGTALDYHSHDWFHIQVTRPFIETESGTITDRARMRGFLKAMLTIERDVQKRATSKEQYELIRSLLFTAAHEQLSNKDSFTVAHLKSGLTELLQNSERGLQSFKGDSAMASSNTVLHKRIEALRVLLQSPALK